jgi:hypothetical protein
MTGTQQRENAMLVDNKTGRAAFESQRRPRNLTSVTAVVCGLCCCSTALASTPIADVDPPLTPQLWEPMPDEFRAGIGEIVVIASDADTDDSISGTYDEATPGLVQGADEGRRMGGVTGQLGGVNVSVPVPVLQLPGMVWGGLSGAAKREIQEFRDALTEDIANARTLPLTNGGLALDVHRYLYALPQVEASLIASTTPVPASADAVLYVGFDGFKIDVQGKEATLILSAKAELRRTSDGVEMYSRSMEYQDTDTLENWTKDDMALWHDYTNFASHYLARELSGEAFYRVLVPGDIAPVATPSAKVDRKDAYSFVSKSLTPELAWQRQEENPAPPTTFPLAESTLTYDIEIYDSRRRVYANGSVTGTSHALPFELEPCQTYRWSVRPQYRLGDDIYYGEWMRREPDEANAAKGRNGLIGRNASVAPAYTQDFPELEIKCGRRR